MAKIYLRERRHVDKGEGRPRFEIVAVSGVDLKVYHTHVRRAEAEAIASDLQAELVYLPRGEGSGEGDGQGAGGGAERGRGEGRPGGRRRRGGAQGEQE